MSRPLASLTSGLLARKGAARPAMRSAHGGFDPAPAAPRLHDDLGWNDFGAHAAPAPEPEPAPAPAPVLATPPAAPVPVPPVVLQQQEIAERLVAPRSRAKALAAGRRAAFTLRLDGERHLALRVAATLTGRSAQALLTEALDRLLAEHPEIPAIADTIRNHR